LYFEYRTGLERLSKLVSRDYKKWSGETIKTGLERLSKLVSRDYKNWSQETIKTGPERLNIKIKFKIDAGRKASSTK